MKKFKSRHPYGFWQLIGWGGLTLDLWIFLAGAFLEPGEWIYPVIVFLFIFSIMDIVTSPIIVRLKIRRDAERQKAEAEGLSLFKRDRFEQLAVNFYETRTKSAGKTFLLIVIGAAAFLGPIILATAVGEYVSVVLGLVLLGLSLVAPLVFVIISTKRARRGFYKIKNGEKRVELKRGEAIRLYNGKTLALLYDEELTPSALDFFYNWAYYYTGGCGLTVYTLFEEDLSGFEYPKEIFFGKNYLVCIPFDGFNIRNTDIFLQECAAMGAYGLYLVIRKKAN